jgi:hypothetical protein
MMDTVLIVRLEVSMLGHICTFCLCHIYQNVFGIFPRCPQQVALPRVRIHCKAEEYQSLHKNQSIANCFIPFFIRLY